MSKGWGALSIAVGTVPVLAAAGLIPGESAAPPWVVGAGGLLFIIGGVLVILRTRAVGSRLEDGLVLAMLAGFAAIGTWIAIGPGPRAFESSFGGGDDLIGRVVFGLGALLVWLCVAAVARQMLSGRGGR